jgi:hypothetical protein
MIAIPPHYGDGTNDGRLRAEIRTNREEMKINQEMEARLEAKIDVNLN